MTKGQPKNVAASVKQRLLNLARERGEEFNLLLVWYGIERLLYRLSRSEYADGFVLKGAMLFHLFGDASHRPTRDVDLLGSGSPDLSRMEGVFSEVCMIEVEDDGLTFDRQSVLASRIREEEEYEGIRVEIVGQLETARIRLQIDIGFGDAITPGPEERDIPCLLESPSPRLRVYPWETVVAEKYQALVELGMANSRMKDFFDLRHLAKQFEFDGAKLSAAIEATFKRRKTEIPESTPVSLTPTYTEDEVISSRWTAFLRRSRLEDTKLSLREVGEDIWRFLEPVTSSLRTESRLHQTWPPGGPWG